MKKYTREEIIAVLAQNVSVSWKSYGTWKIESDIGCNDHCIEVSEITHSEEDETGIMDGETYNPQDINEWFEDVFKYECPNNDDYLEAWYDAQDWDNFDDVPDMSDDVVSDMYDKWYASVIVGDPILKGLFEDYCEAVWSDGANEDNYESYEARDTRLAESLFDILLEDDRVVACGDGYLILTEAEAEFLCNNNGWRADLYEGKLDDFAEAFKQWEDEK